MGVSLKFFTGQRAVESETLVVLACLYSQVAALWTSFTCELVYGAQSKAAKGDQQVLCGQFQVW